MLARTAVVVAAVLTTACAGGPPRSPMESGAVWREIESEHFRLVTDLDVEIAEGELERFEQAYDAMVQAAFPLSLKFALSVIRQLRSQRSLIARGALHRLLARSERPGPSCPSAGWSAKMRKLRELMCTSVE